MFSFIIYFEVTVRVNMIQSVLFMFSEHSLNSALCLINPQLHYQQFHNILEGNCLKFSRLY